MAPVRAITPGSRSAAASVFGSMIHRASGHAVSRSSSRGIGCPSTLARPTSSQVSDPMLPPRSVTRSNVSSWNAASTPSAVAWASVSR